MAGGYEFGPQPASTIAEIGPEVMTILIDALRKGEAGRRPFSDLVLSARREMVRSLREHSLLILTVGVFCVAGRLLPIWLGVSAEYADHLYSTLFFSMSGIALVLFAIGYAIYLRLVVRPHDFLARLARDLRSFVGMRRVCIALPVLLLMPFFGATFTNLKMLIPAIVPFHWDPTFAEWDRMLHGGIHPWQLLHALFGHPYVTSFINAVYHSWFFLSYGVLLWQAVDTNRPRLRMQYLLSFLLIWALIGNVAAIILSSAGPVYFGRVTGLADPFAPLMDYLHQASHVSPVPALGVQETLWRTYAAKGLAIGGGISAMPSLHVAIAFSFVLLARQIDRRLAIAAMVFTALILIGSVHLGWHYAIDGYVAIALSWLIWRAVGWLLNRRTIAATLGFEQYTFPGTPIGRPTGVISR